MENYYIQTKLHIGFCILIGALLLLIDIINMYIFITNDIDITIKSIGVNDH